MMKSQIIIVSVLVVAALSNLGRSQLSCDKKSGPCICKGTGFVGVDITGALRDSTKKPVDPLPPLKYVYPIDFCNGRTCKNDEKGGQNAAACQKQIDNRQNVSTKLGDIKQCEWQVFSNDTFAVKFDGGDAPPSGGSRSAMLYVFRTNSSRKGIVFNQVSFNEERRDTVGDITNHVYVFSVHIITKRGSGSIAGPIGLTLIFLAIAVLIVYFIIGIIILYKVKDKRGIEAIPNSTFWMSLPLLIKDGFMFTISPCLKLADHHSKSSYQSL